MAPRHRIAWRSAITGHTGYGKWQDASRDLTPWIEYLNRDFPGVHHWIETEPSWSEVDTSCEDTEIVQ